MIGRGATLAILFAGSVSAATIVKTVDRKFPTGQFCPLETRTAAGADLSFVAQGTVVRVTFTADNFKGQCKDELDSLGQPCLIDADCPPNETCQRLCTTSFSPCSSDADCPGERCGPSNEVALDNVAVVLESVFEANALSPSPWFEDCYFATVPPGQVAPGSPNAPSHDFNAPGSTEVYLELFDSADGLAGWEGEIAFDTTHLAPRVPAGPLLDDLDQTGGSLGLGRIDDGAVAVSASRTVSGLTPGETYVVLGWWSIRLADRLTIEVNDDACLDEDGDGSVACGGCDPEPGQTCDCDDARPHCAASCVDDDADGWCTDTDCDDESAACAESCTEDLDIDGLPDCLDGCIDVDGDGFGTPGGVPSTCTGADCDDANGQCNQDCTDFDGDLVCFPRDCNDAYHLVFPGAPEANDGVDNQCPGEPGFGAIDELDPTVTLSKIPAGAEICWVEQLSANGYELVRSIGSRFPGPCAGGLVQAPCLTDPEVPLEGQAFHYLVRPTGPYGGSWGNDSQGVERSHVCFDPAQDSLVLNEVDYDQPSFDTLEFVELYNRGSAPVALDGLALVLVNGATNTEYRRILLSGSLPGQGFALIHAPALVPTGELNFVFSAAQDNVQNGSPDAIALLRVADGVLLDALSYEGAVTAAVISGHVYNLVEGAQTFHADSNTTVGALVRLPDGDDTDNSGADWRFSGTPTPGGPNVP